MNLHDRLHRYKVRLIVRAYKMHDENATRTAEALGVTDSTILRAVAEAGANRQMNQSVDVLCDECGTTFRRRASQIKRRKKVNTSGKLFCSNTCRILYANR